MTSVRPGTEQRCESTTSRRYWRFFGNDATVARPQQSDLASPRTCRGTRLESRDAFRWPRLGQTLLPQEANRLSSFRILPGERLDNAHDQALADCTRLLNLECQAKKVGRKLVA